MPASFLYPPRGNFSVANNGMPINYADTLYIQYNSTYNNVDLRWFCSNYKKTNGSFANAVGGLPTNGTFRSGSLLSQNWPVHPYPTSATYEEYYPLNCQFWLMESYGAGLTLGENFTATADPSEKQATFSPVPSASINSVTERNAELGSGAKAGIGVGVSMAILLIAGSVSILMRLRRKRRITRNTPQEARGDVDATITDKPELAGSIPRPTTKKVEMAADSVQELHGDEQYPVHELAE